MDAPPFEAALLAEPVAPRDGRQSPAALAIARGTMRALRALGFCCIQELPLASGRRADIVALGPKGTIWIVEIKSCADDFRTDRKWRDYRLHCDRLLFAVDCAFPLALLPDDAGLIVADAYDGRLLREAPEHPLAGATRRAMILRFARTAAQRMHALCDPAVGEVG
jgi:hypothetical protein